MANAAYALRDSGISYQTLDCQAFVERCLRDLGINTNWRGSNHMFREMVTNIRIILTPNDQMQPGTVLFTLKNDGGEKSRGYNDGIGNAAHVGIYTGMGKGAMHSTTPGGVQQCAAFDGRWTHAADHKLLDYSTASSFIRSERPREIKILLEQAIILLEGLENDTRANSEID